MAFTEVFAGIAIADIGSAREWYERLTGRPPDMLPNDNEAAWQLAGHGWVYLVGLAERGLEPGPVETLANGVRKAAITDPDGNKISFGEVKPPA